MYDHTGLGLSDVPTTNRFSLLSQSDACPENEELGIFSGLHLVSSCSVLNSRSLDNRARKQNTDSDVQTGCTQSEDMDVFASSLRLTSAGFDPVRPSSIHTSVSEFTHPLTVKSFQQLGSEFGCIPLGDFKLYTGPPMIWQSALDIIQALN